KRKSWPGATPLTTTAPGPLSAVPQRIASLVPSMASTAPTATRPTTTGLPRADGAGSHNARLPPAGLRHHARHGEATADIAPLRLGRLALRPRARGADPVTEERPLVEQLDAEPGHRGLDGPRDVAVEQRAGASHHASVGGVGLAGGEQVAHPELA